MFAATLALAVVAAQPLQNFVQLFSTDDYPAAALSEQRGGTIVYELFVSADGNPIQCGIIYSSSWKDLDLATCEMLVRRARFKPALDSEGQASQSVYKGRVSWAIPGSGYRGSPIAPRADIVLTVAKLPSGISQPAIADVAFMVGSDGTLSDCTPVLSWSIPPQELTSAQRIRDKLGKTACSSIEKMLQPRPMLSDGGQPAASVQTAKVSFEIDAEVGILAK